VLFVSDDRVLCYLQYWQLLFSIAFVIITHFFCYDHHIISCYYISLCHLAFVLLDELVELHRILTLDKGLYFKIGPF